MSEPTFYERGIKAHLLKEARISVLPSTVGPCEKCEDETKGSVRYFVAAKLPRHLYLCDAHYLLIRDALEKALKEVLEAIGLQAVEKDEG